MLLPRYDFVASASKSALTFYCVRSSKIASCCSDSMGSPARGQRQPRGICVKSLRQFALCMTALLVLFLAESLAHAQASAQALAGPSLAREISSLGSQALGCTQA